MLDLTEKARRYTESEASRVENERELARLRQHSASLELRVAELQGDLQRARNEVEEQKEATTAAESAHLDSQNSMRADYEARLVRAENRLIAATRETEQVTAQRDALGLSLEEAIKQNTEQDRAIQDLELDARENAERIQELTAAVESLKENANKASALRMRIKKLYKESLQILQDDDGLEGSPKKRRIE